MAIVTDQTITIHGVSVGISKPIQTLIANGDFTYAELSKFAIVGRHDFVNNKAGVFEPDTYSYMAGTSAAISELEKYPVLNDPTAPGWDSVLYTYFGSGNRSYDNYGKMVLVYNMTSSANNIDKNFNDGNTACIVTEFNPRLIKMLGNIYTGNVVADAGDTGSYTIYEPEASRSFVWMDDDTSAPFSSMCIQNFDDAYYFDFPLYNNIFNTQQNINGNRDSTYVSLNYIFDDYMLTGNKLLSVWCDGGIDDFLVGANYGTSFVGVHDMTDDRGDKILLVRYVPYGAECSTKASSLDTALKQLAGCGFYFEANGTIYKPITEGGIVTGYTAELDKNSEWDLINDVTGNTIPDTPGGGGGGGDDDDYDDMGIGVGTNVGGLTNYAIMSIRDLATLLADFNEHLETGMSIQNNFVCLYKLGPLSSFLCNTSVRAIVMSANADENFVSVDDYSVVSGQKGEHYFGSYDVPRFTNTFYDFSPYSTYELFIPCCGWVPLPDTVAGRKIDVYLIFDLASCTCKGVVRISGTTVAEVSGVLGASVPFYMIEHGMERLAQVTAITQTLSSLAVGGVGAASGNAGVAAYGLSQLTQSLNDLNVSGNTNFTAIKGGNGDMSAMGNGEYCTIKITHPVVDSVVDNSMFGHSVGYLCNAIGKLSTFNGFTVCGNPHVTFSATAEEREEIERLLSMGVIL